MYGIVCNLEEEYITWTSLYKARDPIQQRERWPWYYKNVYANNGIVANARWCAWPCRTMSGGGYISVLSPPDP